MTTPTDASLQELRDLARSYEPDRYLAATLAAEPARAALITLAAYAADLARIAATAKQPMLGEIRLQWWRDTLDSIASTERSGSPLADALAEAVKAYNLPVPMLAAMTEARAWDLYGDPMPDAAALDGYLSKSEAIPFELALRVLGVAAGNAVRLSGPAGRAYGMTRLLLRLPAHLARGRMPLPLQMLVEHDIGRDTLPGDAGGQAATLGLHALIRSLSRDIEAALASLRPQICSLSQVQRVALLPLAVVPAYLKVLHHRRRDPARDLATTAPLTRVWRIGVAHWTGRL